MTTLHPRALRLTSAVCLSSVIFADGCDRSWSVSVQSPTGTTSRVRTAQGVTSVYFAETHGDAIVRAALEQPADLSFSGVELEAALAFVADKYQVPIQIERSRLAEHAVDLKHLVEAHDLRGPLRLALRTFLKQYDLAYGVQDGVLWITHKNYASQYDQTRIFPVDDLLISPNDPAAQKIDFTALIDVITAGIEPETWFENGGVEGTIEAYEGAGILSLVVRHRDDVLDRVEWLLTNLRQSRSAAVRDAQAKRPRSTMPPFPSQAPFGGMSQHRNLPGGCVF